MSKYLFFFLVSFNIFSQELLDLNWKNTGSNMTVGILQINDNMVEDGDTLAVFYDLPDNKTACGGFVVWNNDKVALTIWGNDNTTFEKDGFASNEEFLPIFHIKKGVKRKVLNPTFFSGSKYFSHNGLSVIQSLD